MQHEQELPLHGIEVVDLGFGHAAALTAKFLADCGARVVRLEPEQGDPFYDIYPAYRAWRSALSEVERATPDRISAALASADIVLVGGERLAGLQPPEVPVSQQPRNYILAEIQPGLSDEGLSLDEGSAAPSSDLLIQAISGMMYETGLEEPAMLGYSTSGLGGCLQALVAIGTALFMRERHGKVASVRVGLVESALTTFSPLWSWADEEPLWFSFNIPRAARPIIARCSDGNFVHVVLGSLGAKYRLYKVLGIEADLDPSDPGLPDPSLPDDQYFGDIPLISEHITRWSSDDLLAALGREKIVAGPVLSYEQATRLPQVQHNGIIREYEGGFRQPGLLIRFAPAATKGERRDRDGHSGEKPLAGVRAVNFGAYVAGPTASLHLRDLGAETFKVENEKGDPMRGSAKFFAAANRGMRSVTIDMKADQGRVMAQRLIESADIVCSNFKVGVAERMGIDGATLLDADPAKIVLFNSGFGSTGPMSDLPAFDPMMQALSGLELRAGGTDNLPALTRTMPIDTVGGLLGEIAILLALVFRERTGRGAAMEVPLLNSPWMIMSDIVFAPDGSLVGPVELMKDRRGYTANEHVYRTSDGWVALAARTAGEKRALAEMFDLGDPNDWSQPVMEQIAAKIASIETHDLLKRLKSTGIDAVSPVDTQGRPIVASQARQAMGLNYAGDRGPLRNVHGIGHGFVIDGHDIRATSHVPVRGEANAFLVKDLKIDG
ncbi:CoA transferase [Sphingobium sp. JS3065]|uniref:CoA transferase n=1 Tax=Sphingobium sp. JS3065 TaxID=2970925 RepID=UPI002263FA0F|nr:CoA transferase [Sphingobium sp. JS3065]UZW57535.1 CoA transferase [Sphingobium sp. JS3065]